MKKSLKLTTLLILASALLAVFGTSCGTIRGIGQDVGTVGDGIRQSAR